MITWRTHTRSGPLNGLRTAPETKRVTATRLPSPQIREASFNDYPQIRAVLERNRLSARPFEEWADLWRRNPACRGRPWPLGWVLDSGNGELVGTIGNVPGAYTFRGRCLISAAAGDWAVDEPYRRYSLILLDRL